MPFCSSKSRAKHNEPSSVISGKTNELNHEPNNKHSVLEASAFSVYFYCCCTPPFIALSENNTQKKDNINDSSAQEGTKPFNRERGEFPLQVLSKSSFQPIVKLAPKSQCQASRKPVVLVTVGTPSTTLNDSSADALL